jgi:hypothetical protein
LAVEPRDVAQEAAHDLAGAGLGQRVGEADLLGSGQRPDLLGDVAAQLLGQGVVGRDPGARRHEGDDGLALELVGAADDRGLGDLGVRDQRALDLHGRQAVAGDVDDVVDAAHDPEVAVSSRRAPSPAK